MKINNNKYKLSCFLLLALVANTAKCLKLIVSPPPNALNRRDDR